MADIKQLIESTRNTHIGSHNNTHQNIHPKRKYFTAHGLDENWKPVSYCWTHGITYNLCRKSEGHKDESTFTNELGRCIKICENKYHILSTWNVGITKPSLYDRLKHNKHLINHKLNNVVSTPPASIELKYDTGATNHFTDTASHNLQQVPTPSRNISIVVIVPNGDIMTSISTMVLPINNLPESATTTHGLSSLASGFLLSIGNICGTNWTTILKISLSNYTIIQIIKFQQRSLPFYIVHKIRLSNLFGVPIFLRHHQPYTNRIPPSSILQL